MCNSRETRRDDSTRFVVMGTGMDNVTPIADCESLTQAEGYVKQMAETYKSIGLNLTISEVQTYPYD